MFEDGGDYAEKEVNICIASIRDIMYTFEKQVNNHHRDVDAIQLQQEECLEEFEKYKITYASALVDLSMKEGLGKKFGKPRRHAQEALRTEVNQSTTSEDEISQLLNILKSIGDIKISTHFNKEILLPTNVLQFEQNNSSNSSKSSNR